MTSAGLSLFAVTIRSVDGTTAIGEHVLAPDMPSALAKVVEEHPYLPGEAFVIMQLEYSVAEKRSDAS